MKACAKLLLSGSLVMAANLAMPGAAFAARVVDDPARIEFAIPAQPLATALIAFGKQANVQVLTSGCAIARFRSPGASGTLTPQAALE
uniref:hypothetical protein n=1 Tax=Dyella sp. EPa41 TaxID=1561194 RepID=UPI00191589DE